MNLYEILMDTNVVKSINNNLEYLLEIIPEIKFMIGFEHKHPHHHLDVWQHTLLALSESEPNFDIRLSLLLHDVGKPFSYQEEDNIRHFKGHAEVSATMSIKILKRLNFDEEYVNKICFYIRNHDEEITDELIKDNPNIALTMFKIQKSDALAHNPNKLEKRKIYLETISKKNRHV